MSDTDYAPGDSRNITLKKGDTPFEPPRTGPREEEARAMAEDDAAQDNSVPNSDA